MVATKGRLEPTYVRPESKKKKLDPSPKQNFLQDLLEGRARHLFFEGVSSFSWKIGRTLLLVTLHGIYITVRLYRPATFDNGI